MTSASMQGQAFGATPGGSERWSLCAGTFLICLSLLAFEISTVRTISFALGQSFIYLAISIAMLGLTAAGSILSLVKLNALRTHRTAILFWSCLAIAAFLIAAQFMVTANKAEMNALVEAAGREGGLEAMLPVLLTEGFFGALEVGFFLSLPYFLFGGLLSFLFATTDGIEHARLYACDLIGAALGCTAAVLLMELTSYAFSVTAPAVIAAFAAGAYAAVHGKKRVVGAIGIAAVLGAAPLLPAYEDAIEPVADPHFLVRDYNYDQDVTEVWHRWNSYSRVGAVRNDGHDPSFVTLSLDNGAGMAWLWPYDPERAVPHLHTPTIPAMLPGPAKSLLVLFAGAGADLMTARENGFGAVTGIELNHTILEAARALPEYRFEELVGADNVTLNRIEGRAFLEQDPARYDAILMSWSGATAVYRMGALGGTTQYLFTKEGLSAILDHLNPGGYAVVLQANKVKMLAALRNLLAERGLGHAERTAIILFSRNNTREWNREYDDNPLLIKPSGWTDAEVATIVENAKRHNFEIAYAPGHPTHPEYTVYRRMITAPDPASELAALRAETGLRFDIVTDDRPYYLDLFDNGRFFSSDFWLGIGRGTLKSASEKHHFLRVMIVIVIGIAAFSMAIGPLLLSRRPTVAARSATYLAYFICLGAGFMFLEIGILQKGSLIFGDPSLTISLVLGSIILFTGIGSLISNWSFDHGLNFRIVATLTVIYILALISLLNPILYSILTWPIAAKALVLAAVIAPGAILMGHLFPQGLALARQEDPTLVPWAWAVNGAMSAFIAGAAPLVAQALGFQALFVAAAALYTVVIVLPLALPARSPTLARA